MANEIYEVYGGYLHGLEKSWNSSPCDLMEQGGCELNKTFFAKYFLIFLRQM